MPTISKKQADALMTLLRAHPRPKTYCVLRYRNAISGRHDYWFGKTEQHYQECLHSYAVCEVEVHWASPRFRKTHPDVTVVE